MDEETRRVVTNGNIRPSLFITYSSNGSATPAPDYEDDVIIVEEAARDGASSHAIRKPEEAASLLPSISTLCNSAIGAGVLSLPVAFKSVGMLGGILLCLLIGMLEGFTLYVLAKMSERYGHRGSSYSVLVRATLGKKTSAILSILLSVYMWGACIAYLIIMSDAATSTVIALSGVSLDRTSVIAVLALILTPLCCLQRITALSALSSVAILGFLYTSGAIVVNAVKVVGERENPFIGIDLYFTDLRSTFYAIPVIVFGFNCHANVTVVMHELEMGPDLTLAPAEPPVNRVKSKKLLTMILVISASVGLIFMGYVGVGMAGYATYGKSTSSNILNDLPQDETWSIVARALIFVVVFGHYPLSHHPARSSMETLLSIGHGGRASIIFTLVFVVTSASVASAVSDLGSVLHLLGGTVAALIIFGLPGAMLVNSAIVKDSKERIMEEIVSEVDDLSRPLLEDLQMRATKGIKSGFVYSPRKSWVGGLALIFVASAIMALTVIQLIW